MLSETLGDFLKDNDCRRLSNEFDSITTRDHWYSNDKMELEQLIVELVTLAYRKARSDERYRLYGPVIDPYSK